MAYFWSQNPAGKWSSTELKGDRFALEPAQELTVRIVSRDDIACEDLALVRRAAAGRERWVLLLPPRADVSLNGLRPLGLALLRHRDELLLGPWGARLLFSDERPARVEPFPGPAQASCPRCRLPIEPGMDSVRCPVCQLVHHQTDDRPCWTYAPRCAGCDCQTGLDGRPAWSPEGL